MSDFILKLDEAEAEQIAHRAKERGYTSLVDYLMALVAADELVTNLREDWRDADESSDVIESSFRESWHDAMTGNVLPIDALWEKLDDE